MTDLDRLRHRLQLVEGLIRALDAGGELLDAIRSCADRAEAHALLMAAPWNFHDAIASHVLDMPYSRSTRLNRDALAEELTHLRKEIAQGE